MYDTQYTHNYAQNLMDISFVCRYSGEVMDSVPAKMRGGDSGFLCTVILSSDICCNVMLIHITSVWHVM